MESYIFNAHSEPICKRLNILKLPDLYNLQLYFKIKREVVPQYLTTSIPNKAAVVDRPSVRPSEAKNDECREGVRG